MITRVDPSEQQALAAHMPWIAEMKMIDDKADGLCVPRLCLRRAVDGSGGACRAVADGAEATA